MTCEQLQEDYELYATGLLAGEAVRQEIDAHLARRCPHCTRGIREANDSFSLMALTAPQVQPPADLRERIRAAARNSAPVIPFAPPAKKTPVWQNALPWAAAACLLLGLGYYQQAEQRRTEELVTVRVALQQMENARKLEQAELERLRPLADFLRQPDTKVVTFGESAKEPPRGRVLVSPSRGVVLMASNLPALPAGRIFQMWLIPKTKGGAPRPAGLFQATGGSAVHLQPGVVDAGDTAAVAVTIEPSEGSAAPTTTPIVVAPIPAL